MGGGKAKPRTWSPFTHLRVRQSASANYILDRLMTVVEGLAQFLERGSHPKELVALGIKEYRQTSFKPDRVIYRELSFQFSRMRAGPAGSPER